MKRRAAVCAAALALLGSSAVADEVRLKNGDRITGKVASLESGKLKLTGTKAGDVTVDVKDVESFSTDGPVEIHLKDGTVLKRRVEAGDAGTLTVEGRQFALADVEHVNPPWGRWTGSLSVGGMITHGNSKTQSLNVSVEATRRTEDDRLSASGSYIYSRQTDPDTGDSSTTADAWSAAGKYDYFLDEKLYAFFALRAEHDTVGNLDLRLTPSLGVGYQWVERPDMNFSTEAGLAWVYEDYADADSEDHFAARFAYHFDRKLNDKVSIVHNVEYVPSLEDLSDFNTLADLGVRATLTKNMFAEFKAEWRHDATPAPDSAKNDLRYVLGVGWAF